MWVIPKNFQPCSAFVRDTVESKKDLNLLETVIESSLMWRSKPSPLQTWSRRWSRVNWLPHLFGRILKPSQHISFENALTSSLEVIHASRFQMLERGQEKMTQEISGNISENTSGQLNLPNVSSRMSRDTFRLDSPQLSATWKKMVTIQRGEYLARRNVAHLTRESGSTFWPHYSIPTPTVGMEAPNKNANTKGPKNLVEVAQGQWDHLWPTPTTQDNNQVKVNSDHPKRGTVRQWPTPSARDHKGGYKGGRIRNGKVSMDTLDVAVQHTDNKAQTSGTLNPTWVEWLMGLPTGWTDLDSWETE